MIAIRRAKRELLQANSYNEWSEAAKEYDRLSGLSEWKEVDYSKDYDFLSVRSRLENLVNLRKSGDFEGLLFALNEGVHGNIDGMGKSVLYSYSKFGTKSLVEEYVEELIASLRAISNCPNEVISGAEKLDFFQRASTCFGRSALMLSGSGGLFFFHIGVIRALREKNLVPDVISGSSGGSLVGCIIATHSRRELDKVLTPEFFIELTKIVANKDRGSSRLVISDEAVRAMIEHCLPDLTFQEAYEKTGVQMNVSIAPYELHQTSRLLNHITTPNVCLREAALASAAAPGFFAPTTLIAKDRDGSKKSYLPQRKWVDGALSDDLPAKRLSRLYGVNHFIVSQTNPHIIPFVSDSSNKAPGVYSSIGTAVSRVSKEALLGGVGIASSMVTNEGKVGRLLGGLRSLINQNYSGDINILPPFRFINPVKLLSVPEDSQVIKLIKSGEFSTWPKMEMIRNQTCVSKELTRLLDRNSKAWGSQQCNPK